MNMPGYSAETSLYRSTNHYTGGIHAPGVDLGVTPALPSCGNCMNAIDSCFKCIDKKGGKFSKCPSCTILSHCGGACEGHGGGGGGEGDPGELDRMQCMSACQGNLECIDTFC